MPDGRTDGFGRTDGRVSDGRMDGWKDRRKERMAGKSSLEKKSGEEKNRRSRSKPAEKREEGVGMALNKEIAVKTGKVLLAGALAGMMVMPAVSAVAYGSEVVAGEATLLAASSGACGENASWSFNAATGALTITGSGAVYDYETGADNASPWGGYSGLRVKSVKISEGITSIGDYAFYDCPTLVDVTIPDSVSVIGQGAFSACPSLASVALPTSVYSIGAGAFSGLPSGAAVVVSSDAQYEALNEVWSEIVGKGGRAKLVFASDALITQVDLRQDSVTYNGYAQKPALTVYAGNRRLADTDYTAVWSGNCINAGTYTVTVTGDGVFTGHATAVLTIEPKELKSSDFSLASTSLYYTGTALAPEVKKSTAASGLKAGTDYTVAYSNNVNAGTATVTITGKGNCTGAVTKTFSIKTMALKAENFALSGTEFTYTGGAITPRVTNALGLIEGTDYTVTYSNNVRAGKATVKIAGKGNCSGTAVLYYTINKAKQPDLVVKNPKIYAKGCVSGRLANNKYFEIKTKGVKDNARVTFTKGNKAGGSRIAVAGNGRITVSKGIKKGTYKVKLAVKLAQTTNYEEKNLSKYIKVVVK